MTVLSSLGRLVAAVRIVAATCLALWVPTAAHAQSEAVEYYGLDALGSMRLVFDANGNVLSRMDYGPFGQELVPSMSRRQNIYAGLFTEEEAGLNHAEARSYQSRTGRFSTVDPVYAGVFEPQSWNRYAYALNNPIQNIDPTGLLPNGCKTVSSETHDATGRTIYLQDTVCAPVDPWSVMLDRLGLLLDGLGIELDRLALGDFDHGSRAGTQGGRSRTSSPVTLDDVLKVSSDATAGLGDSLLLGYGENLREAIGLGGIVNRCSNSYLGGTAASLVAGGARLGYAASAKTLSLLSMAEVRSGASVVRVAETAVANRNTLKRIFRAGAFYNTGMADVATLAAGGKTSLQMIQSAGRTYNDLNVVGAIIYAGANVVNGNSMSLTQSASNVLVRDYANLGRVYRLDRAHGDHQVVAGADPIRTAGFGLRMRNRASRQRVSFVAIFSQTDTLWLQIDNQSFNLRDSAIGLKLTSPMPFVRHFTVVKSGSAITEIRTLARLLELREWPLAGDFLRFLCDTTASEEAILRAMLRWDAASTGLNLGTSSVQDKIEAQVRELLVPRSQEK
jgi:RHS repeat-associated protein